MASESASTLGGRATSGVATTFDTSLPVGTIGVTLAEGILCAGQIVDAGRVNTASFRTFLPTGASFDQLVLGMTALDGAVWHLHVILTRVVTLGVFGNFVQFAGVDTAVVYANQATTAFRIFGAVATHHIFAFAGAAHACAIVVAFTTEAAITAVVAVTGTVVLTNATLAGTVLTLKAAVTGLAVFASTTSGSFGTGLTDVEFTAEAFGTSARWATATAYCPGITVLLLGTIFLLFGGSSLICCGFRLGACILRRNILVDAGSVAGALLTVEAFAIVLAPSDTVEVGACSTVGCFTGSTTACGEGGDR